MPRTGWPRLRAAQRSGGGTPTGPDSLLLLLLHFFRLLLLLLVLSLFVHFIRDALIRHEVVPDRNIACCRCANDADFVPAHRLHIINSSCDKARPRLERCGRYSTRGEGIERWRMEREYRDWVQDWVPGSSHGHLSYYERRCPLVLLSFCPGVTLSSCRCCRPRPRCCCSCYCCCYRCCCCRWRCRCPLPVAVLYRPFAVQQNVLWFPLPVAKFVPPSGCLF